jgi:hypothetical protein
LLSIASFISAKNLLAAGAPPTSAPAHAPTNAFANLLKASEAEQHGATEPEAFPAAQTPAPKTPAAITTPQATSAALLPAEHAKASLPQPIPAAVANRQLPVLKLVPVSQPAQPVTPEQQSAPQSVAKPAKSVKNEDPEPEITQPAAPAKPQPKEQKIKETRKQPGTDAAAAPSAPNPPVLNNQVDTRSLVLSLPKAQEPPPNPDSSQSANTGRDAGNNNSPASAALSSAQTETDAGATVSQAFHPIVTAPLAFSVRLPNVRPVPSSFAPRSASQPVGTTPEKISTSAEEIPAPITKPVQLASQQASQQRQNIASQPRTRTNESEPQSAGTSKSTPDATAKSQPAAPAAHLPVTNVIAAPQAATEAATAAYVPAAYANNQTAKPVSTAPPSPITEVADVAPQTAAARPQTIDLKIPGDNHADVAVRVSQRAGDVEVTVRTADGDLAQSLKQHLPELSDRLGQNGVHGDIWQPSAAQSSSADSGAGDRDAARGNQSYAQQQQQRNPNQAPDPGDQENQGRRAPSWFDELNSAKKETY